MTYKQIILDSLGNLEEFESEMLPDGTELIGRVPHVAPEAGLHLFFAPATDEQIQNIQDQIGTLLPSDYANFLLEFNGISLFSNALYLYGARKNYKRSGNDVWQPFDIVVPNTLERPDALESSEIIIGGYTLDGSRLCMNRASGEIFRIDRLATGSVLNRWPDLKVFLREEIARLLTERKYDERSE